MGGGRRPRLRTVPLFFLLQLLAGTLYPAAGQEYSPEQARIFASLSQAAYCGKNDSSTAGLLSWTCVPCRDSGLEVVPGSVRTVRNEQAGVVNATFAYVARLSGSPPFGGKCLVAVRGTASLANWAGNFEFWKEPVAIDECDGCAADTGFYSVWLGLKDGIIGHLRDIGCGPVLTQADSELGTTPATGGGPEVLVTGHSMGGAVAAVAMLTLQRLGFEVEPGIVFHSPRIGNEAFAQAFHKTFQNARPFYRVTRDRDPVPLVPMMDLGFRHVNYEVYYDEAGAFHTCSEPEDPSCAMRHSLVTDLLHAEDHCGSSLVPTGRICGCPMGGEDTVFV